MIASISTCLMSQQMKLCPGARDNFTPFSIVDEKDWLSRTANLQVRMGHPQTINAIPLFALIQKASEDKAFSVISLPLMSSLHSGRFHGSISICHTFISCSSCMVLEIDAFRLATTQGTLEKNLTQHAVRRIWVSKLKSACQSNRSCANEHHGLHHYIGSLAGQPCVSSSPPASGVLASSCEEGWESE